MAYTVRIDRIGRAGMPAGSPRVYEARDEADALTIVAYEVDKQQARPASHRHRDRCRRAPIVHLLRPRGRGSRMTGKEREDWTLADRDARVLIGALLAFQVSLLGMLLFL